MSVVVLKPEEGDNPGEDIDNKDRTTLKNVTIFFGGGGCRNEHEGA